MYVYVYISCSGGAKEGRLEKDPRARSLPKQINMDGQLMSPAKSPPMKKIKNDTHVGHASDASSSSWKAKNVH